MEFQLAKTYTHKCMSSRIKTVTDDIDSRCWKEDGKVIGGVDAEELNGEDPQCPPW